jgi:alpha-D-ribose 1-methylphosphonate 5-triphosphate diphosphatase
MWLSGLRLILPDGVLENGSINIVDGKIAEIVEGPAANADIHASHLTALPGLVDIHGDMLEREVQPRPKANIPVDLALHELDKRLVATGVTTAYAAISFSWENNKTLRSEEKARQLIGTVNRLRPALLADHYVHSRFEITNPDAGSVLKELLADKLVHLVSIMDHTPGQGQYRDIERYVQFAVSWRNMRGEQVTEADVREHIANRKSWPKAWDIVRDVAQFSQEYGITMASHDDDTVEKVRFVSEFGVRISEFPVTAVAAAEARQLGMHVAMGAPNALRGGSLSGNLNAAEAVAEGLVDTLASDYHPASMLHAVYGLARKGILPLHESVKLVTANPAHGVGLTDRGTLAVGKRADIVLVDDRELPRVHGTFRQGVPIYWDRYMVDLCSATKQVFSVNGRNPSTKIERG